MIGNGHLTSSRDDWLDEWLPVAYELNNRALVFVFISKGAQHHLDSSCFPAGHRLK